MNSEQAERFQELLEEACDHHIEYDGGKVVDRGFTKDDGGQCPMTCLFGRVSTYIMASEAGSMLEATISQEELWTLMHSFDGLELMDFQKQYVSAILIGRALRAKYITKE